MTFRSFSELSQISSFEDRYDYLALRGVVGDTTFGFDRWINQQFYRSAQWRRTRRNVIARDLGCDLAVEGHEIHDRIIIHHMNPMRAQDIVHASEDILDPEFLISTTHQTHNAIHYGDRSLLRQEWTPRTPNDSIPWR